MTSWISLVIECGALVSAELMDHQTATGLVYAEPDCPLDLAGAYEAVGNWQQYKGEALGILDDADQAVELNDEIGAAL